MSLSAILTIKAYDMPSTEQSEMDAAWKGGILWEGDALRMLVPV